jgi:hypothetical protein
MRKAEVHSGTLESAFGLERTGCFLIEASEQGLTASRDYIMPAQYSTITSPMIARVAPT